ncbi:hypothetical protein V5738_15945 [Salinisphaera sp. SPP-AMP-43]|uniref:hypothetical protein n=1 Tax=Salinisphaera sp. SPP-AMP-43 TaxID=3121288 RepID=UPI003C6DFEBE
MIDHGAAFASEPNFQNLMELGTFSVIAFDPAGRLRGDNKLEATEELQIISHAILGDGQPASLQACLDPSLSATLEPLPETNAHVLTRLPVGTIALDSITELDDIDWVLLDDRNDNHTILEHGVSALEKALLVHARLPFFKTHHRQTDITDVFGWMANHGFQCYRLDNAAHRSRLDQGLELEKTQATQLVGMDAVFVPTEQRLSALPACKLTKLAFLLDTIYGIHDLAHDLLNRFDSNLANSYLSARSYISRYNEEPDTFVLTAEYSPAPWEHGHTPAAGKMV